MNKRNWLVGLAAMMLALSILACESSVSTANIKSARLSADPSGNPETTTFAPDQQTVYCIVTLANAPDDTKVQAVWTAVEVGDEQPNTLIDQSELTSGDAELTFKLTNNMLWPTGKYKVELYLNGKLDRTIEYQVQ
jgi:hypothetical protein